MYTIRKISKKDLPRRLMEIPEPPAHLFCAGEIPDPDQFLFLTVVGSRKHSEYGREVCQKLLEGLRGYPIVIVSGLAIGIDTIAHETALSIGLPCIAFPGSGLDPETIYPKHNLPLAGRIVHNGGCLLSEYKSYTNAAPWNFPRRNRLMAGISHATLIIEAGEKSGTLITARMALDYNRDVFVVPGSILSESSKGSNTLIKLGAMPVTSSAELLEFLGFDVKPHSLVQNILETCSETEKKVLEILTEPLPRDEIMRRSELSISDVSIILIQLEMKGLIKESQSNIIRLF